MNIVFDIGGTKMRVAAARGDELGEVQIAPTPHEPGDGIAQLQELARAVAAESGIEAVAGCIAGSVNEKGEIFDARNLQEWEGVNIVDELSDAFGVRVPVVHDAAAAGLGEAHVGAGKGASVLVYVTVSTGVGGARIVNGKIDAAGGIGHTNVGESDLESLVSGTAVTRKFGIHPKDLESLEERNKLADLLAEGLAVLVEKWSPDTIVLGGSMIVGVNPIPLARTAESLAKRLTMHPKPPIIKMAQLGDNGGLHGAAILAQEILPALPDRQAGGQAGLSTE
ncbi:MAG: ROK family protein [Patescibacteria group bacterium]